MEFRFKTFSVRHERSAMKVGTDGVLLGCAFSIPEDRPDSRLLDIGTGSGLIALLAAQRFPMAEIEAIEPDEGSYEDALENFSCSVHSDRLRVHKMSLAEYESSLEEGSGIFDAIVSNPPFFSEDTLPSDKRSARAKNSGAAGAMSYHHITAFASKHLTPGGILSMILPASDETRVLFCLRSFGLQPCRLTRIRTSARKQTFRIIVEAIKVSQVSLEIEELCLFNPDGSKSEEYCKLTDQFYL